MKRILTFFLALTMVLSLAACGGKADDNKGKTEVTMTAQEIMDTLKEKLGDSFGCDVAETEDNISGYWGLDMGQVESWASMSNSNSAVNSSYAVIVKVKDGYAQDAAALLQTGYEQILSYKHINRSVSYNNGQYETDSIYERKYLSGSDQYAVFLNSNQAQTVIEGSGKSGKLLLIKDSYGNTFSQFPVEDYAEVHVLDLRFFKGDVTEYAKENGITDTLVLYGTQSFVKDTRLRF